ARSSAAHRPLFLPILRAIEELGGSGQVKDVRARLRQELASVLSDAQLDYLEAKNRYGWARYELRTKGLIGGAKGIWALTDLGRRYVARHRSAAPEAPVGIPTLARSSRRAPSLRKAGEPPSRCRPQPRPRRSGARPSP